jgi:hypothetical protein
MDASMALKTALTEYRLAKDRFILYKLNTDYTSVSTPVRPPVVIPSEYQEQIDNVLGKFNFEEVLSVVKLKNYVIGTHVPDAKTLRTTARNLMNKAVTGAIAYKADPKHRGELYRGTLDSARFLVTVAMNDKGKMYLSLRYCIEQYTDDRWRVDDDEEDDEERPMKKRKTDEK